MADGRYTPRAAGGERTEVRNVRGTRGNPIIICGSPKALVSGHDLVDRPYLFYVADSSWVYLVGFTLRGGSKGVVIDRSDSTLLYGLTIAEVDAEAVHVRDSSPYTTIQNCGIYYTGLMNKGIGEGIYVGSDEDNIAEDASHYTRILYNQIGPGVTAEAIDIKQNSRNGVIQGNVLDCSDVAGENGAVSCIAVKGNGYTVVGNKVYNPLEDGIKVVVPLPGEGRNNHFERNECVGVGGGSTCVRVQDEPGHAGNTVACGQDSNVGGDCVANKLVPK